MVSAPTSPVRSMEGDKENGPVFSKKASLSRSFRRHSMAPSKSILKPKNTNSDIHYEENHTIAVMQVPLRDEPIQKKTVYKRRVSFAPEVTLHKIDFIEQYTSGDSNASSDNSSVISGHDGRREEIEKDDVGRELWEDSSDMEEEPLANSDNTRPKSNIEDNLGSDDDDESDGNVSMEITKTFQQSVQAPHSMTELEEFQAPLNALNIFQNQLSSDEEEEGFEMEFTTNISREKTLQFRQEILASSLGQSQEQEETSMEFTMVTSNIKQTNPETVSDNEVDSANITNVGSQIDADSIMEFTQEIGKINLQDSKESETISHQDKDDHSQQEESIMEFTQAVSVITAIPHVDVIDSSQNDSYDHSQDQSQMELTQAIGTIKEIDSTENIQSPSQSQETEITNGSSQMEFTQEVGGISTVPLEEIREEDEEESGNEVDMEMAMQFVPQASSADIIQPVLYLTPSKSRKSITPRSIRSSATKTSETGSPSDRHSSKKRRLSDTGEYEDTSSTPSKETQTNGLSSLMDRINSLTPSRKRVSLVPRRLSMALDEAIEMEEDSVSQERQLPVFHIQEPENVVNEEEGQEVQQQDVITTTVEPKNYPENRQENRDMNEEEMINNIPLAAEQSPRRTSVITTTIPLAGNADTSQESIDDYVNVPLKDFMESIQVKFYDDLKLRTKPKRRSSTLTRDLSFNQDEYITARNLLPTLELYDFTCRELKKNIADGKELFETLERETFEDNPPLMREYFESNSAVRLNMKSQFQLIKDYARHQAKAVWYSWRTQLIEGLLVEVRKNFVILSGDKVILEENLNKIQEIHTKVSEKHQQLRLKLDSLRKAKAQYGLFERESLKKFREELVEIREQFAHLEESKSSLQENLNSVTEQLTQQTISLKELNNKAIENEKNKLINRNFESQEIETLKRNFEFLQSASNMKFIGISDSRISLLYDGIMTLHVILKGNQAHSIDYVFPTSYDSEVTSLFSERATLFIEKKSYTNTLGKLNEICKVWDTLQQFDRDIFRLGLVYPVRIVESNDEYVMISLRYRSKECKKTSISIKLCYDTIFNQSSGKLNMSISQLSESTFAPQSILNGLKSRCLNNAIIQRVECHSV